MKDIPKHETQIHVNGVPTNIVAYYEYDPATGDGWNEPRHEEEVTIHSVFANGDEIDFFGFEMELIEEILKTNKMEEAYYYDGH